MKLPLAILIASLSFFSGSETLAQSSNTPAPQIIPSAQDPNKDARLAWWREAKFGMFIHWGVYSGFGGEWKGKKVEGYAEHLQRIMKINREEYLEKVVKPFNPVEFNADEWVRTVKATGMQYIVITSMHHDGVAMFDSKVDDY
ncbi:MAG: alpha-L-fucosidase, partial [Verrucomicrobia bacterium]|nr:alpha-L-fucosidase [Verrucomicrobiota bacterium]